MNTTEPIESAGNRSPAHLKSRLVRPLITIAIAAACLAWIFYDIHPERLWNEIRRISWGLVGVAILVDVLSYAVQGLRWGFLMRPLGRLSVLRSTQAVYAGLFVNEIFPLRPGEVLRAFLASRWLSSGILDIFPSIAVERVFDGFWLAVGIGVTAVLVKLPGDLLLAADYLGAFVITAAAVFAILAFRKPKVTEKKTNTTSLSGRLWQIAGKFREGIYKIGINRNLFLSMFASSFILIFQAVSFWLVMTAYHINLPLTAGAAIFFIVYLGTAIPNAPSNIGSYQLFCVLGLALFGVDKTTAAGFSVVVFIVLTIPLWVLGFAALAGSGLKLADLRKDLTKMLRRSNPVSQTSVVK